MFNLQEKEFLILRDVIEKECGIRIADDKSYLIESKLSSLLVENMCFSFQEFCELLKRSNKVLIEKVVDQITINETLWFRDETPWYLFKNGLIDEMVEIIRTTKRKIRIWSTACSSGQEPYSIAMFIDNYLTKNSILDVTLNNFEIIATDISKSVLSISKNAKYDSISMKRGMTEEIKSKYFTSKNNRVWELVDKIKNAITFEKLNLKKDFTKLGDFDLVLCRYVLIYFTRELKLDILKRINDQLNDKGTLILGGGEIYQNKDKIYETKFEEKLVYYKKRGKNNG